MDNITDKLYKIFAPRFNEELIVKPKTAIITEGNFSKKFYYLKKGILRGWTLYDGKEVTFQLLLDNRFFCSIESFWYDKKSLYSVEAIEEATIWSIDKDTMMELLSTDPEVLKVFNEYIIQRFLLYQKLLIDRIKEKPEKRYQELLNSSPEVILRVPQHYIASYLGITSVSLSRIKNRR